MTSRERPTLTELRARAHKQRHREIGNVLARQWGRPSAIYGTWLAVRLGLSADQVTATTMLVHVIAAIALGIGRRDGFVAGVLLLHLAFWLDHVDGQVARWRGTARLSGVYLDYLMHHAAALLTGFALGFGLTLRTGNPFWSLAGFAAAVGWLGLGLHNDCKYKAFFQMLKRGSTRYRVDSGSGGRPAPPASWPRRGFGILTWPAQKACEPHVVLIALSGLGLIALMNESLWLTTLKGYVLSMSLLAPTLAIARVVKAARRDAVDREFAAWFRADS